jgi:hypothetical protein
MSNSAISRPVWRWVQVEGFSHPPHPEWDVVQWNLEDELVLDPYKASHPVFDDAGKWRYMKTKDAPGLQGLPRMVVLFRIAQEPTDSQAGVIEGHEVWMDEDLVTDLVRAIRGRPTL